MPFAATATYLSACDGVKRYPLAGKQPQAFLPAKRNGLLNMVQYGYVTADFLGDQRMAFLPTRWAQHTAGISLQKLQQLSV
jgi:hypothetical protein